MRRDNPCLPLISHNTTNATHPETPRASRGIITAQIPLKISHATAQPFPLQPAGSILRPLAAGHADISPVDLHGLLNAGSSKTVRGNPTEYYRRPGSASSFGAGIKLGSVRAEWATEGDNIKKGHFFLRFGERF